LGNEENRASALKVVSANIHCVFFTLNANMEKIGVLKHLGNEENRASALKVVSANIHCVFFTLNANMEKIGVLIMSRLTTLLFHQMFPV